MRKLPKLGKPIEGHEERDAIHIAIIPAKVLGELSPGQSVRLVDRDKGDKFYTVCRTEKKKECIGIIDPFLNRYVEEGETVWVFLLPNTVTDMRHHWEHPAFEDFVDELDSDAEKTFRYLKYGDSIEFMRKFATKVDMSYQELLDALTDYVNDGTENIHIGVDTPYEDTEKMWDSFEKITGIKVSGGIKHQTPFSCSC